MTISIITGIDKYRTMTLTTKHAYNKGVKVLTIDQYSDLHSNSRNRMINILLLILIGFFKLSN